MKKILALFLMITTLSMFTACSSTQRDDANKEEMNNGQVVEVEGEADQYGWMPHMRLTFTDDILTEVYFDYISEETSKKSQDEEYNATMKEKTGVSVKDAMETLREDLLATQDPEELDVITGATQTSIEFIEMAAKAFDNYEKGNTSANNYGEGDAVEQAVENGEKSNEPTEDPSESSEGSSSEDSEEGSMTSSNQPHYANGGDANPNFESDNGESQNNGMW